LRKVGKMTTVTSTRVGMIHPYRVAGIIMVVLSFGVLAFSLGVLNRCGGGSGVCFDLSSHASGDAGLILFVLLLIIGVALIAYTGSADVVTTRTATPTPPTPSVTVVNPPVAAAPQPTVTNVYPTTPAKPETTVVVNERP
jgi:hypothetical protein